METDILSNKGNIISIDYWKHTKNKMIRNRRTEKLVTKVTSYRQWSQDSISNQSTNFLFNTAF
jgi:hypothetical protein